MSKILNFTILVIYMRIKVYKKKLTLKKIIINLSLKILFNHIQKKNKKTFKIINMISLKQ